MTLKDSFSNVVKRGWLIILIGSFAGLLVAMVANFALPKSYQASVVIYVSVQAQDSNATSAYEGGLLSEQRVRSYTQLIASDRVANDVIRRLGLATTSQELTRQISAESEPDTVLFTTTVTDSDPYRAAQIANTAAESFQGLVATLEQPADLGRQPLVVAKIAQAAVPDATPVSPRFGTNLILGLAFGTLLGLLLAYVRVTGDNSVRTEDELRRITGAPTIGAIPRGTDGASDQLAMIAEPQSREAEEFRRVRANLQYLDVDRGCRSILITSAVAGEGKTTSVCNLALALGFAGSRVALVDCDLRRPQVADYLGLEPSVGLTSVLTGQVDSRTALQLSQRNVWVLASGAIPPNPAELLSSLQMRQLVDELRSRFDYVLLDSPPVLPVADALSAAPLVDGVILACKGGNTRGPDAEQAANALSAAGGKIVGGVLTMFDVSRAKRGGYAAYYSQQSQPTAVARSASRDVREPAAGAGSSEDHTAVTSEIQSSNTGSRPAPKPRRP